MAFYKWIVLGKKNSQLGRFILILLVAFFIWHALSLFAMISGYMQHMIIFSYYLALILPSLYLYRHQKSLQSGGRLATSNLQEDVISQYHITEREQVLIHLLIAGKSNQEIAEEMFISLQSVKNYISRIFAKTRVKNRVQLVNLFRNSRVNE